MKTALFGNNRAAVLALEELLAAGHEVVCVVNFRHRAHAWHESLFDAARRAGVRSVFDPRNVNDAFFADTLRRFGPDLVLSVYFDQRLARPLLDLPRLGAFNVHPALLPAYRGVAPLIWALANGEPEVGVTLHEMVEQFDAGDIVLQERIPVEADDTGFALHCKAAEVARRLVRRFLEDPAGAVARKRPQTGPASYYARDLPPLNPIVWTDPAIRIRNIVRALTEPLPCAHTHVGERQVLLLEAPVQAGVTLPPGQVRFAARGELLVGTGSDALHLMRMRVAGVELRSPADEEDLRRIFEGATLVSGAAGSAVRFPEPRLSRYVVFGAPVLGVEEETAVVETLRSGWIGMGEKTLALERAFEELTGAPRCLSFHSATSALFLALKTLPVGPGDEVITSPLTFAATCNVIEHLGARPIFADIDPRTLNIDPREVEARISPRTRALLPVHFGGLSCDMDALEDIARRHRVPIVEDAAHAVGGRHGGRPIGGRGHLAAFSLYANKNVTSVEGGILSGVPEPLAERLRALRMHGLSNDAYRRFTSRTLILSQVVEPGFKMNLTDVQAAIGLAQLRKLGYLQSRREALARIYDEYFPGDLPVRRPERPEPGDETRHALHLYVLLLDLARLRLGRNEVVQALRDLRVGAAIHYEAIFFHPYYRKRYGHEPSEYPHAAAASESILSLPLSPSLTDDEAHAVARTVVDVLRWCAR